MLGFSFSEVVVIAIVALVFVGPQKLPGLLRTLGTWARKLRMMSHEMRAQSGIDDVLRAEGLHGGLHELRSLMRGQNFYNPTTPFAPAVPVTPPAPLPEPPPPEPAEPDPYAAVELDVSREYPPEGPDAYGAIADDLVDDGLLTDVAPFPADLPPEPEPEPTLELESAASEGASADEPASPPEVATAVSSPGLGADAPAPPAPPPSHER